MDEYGRSHVYMDDEISVHACRECLKHYKNSTLRPTHALHNLIDEHATYQLARAKYLNLKLSVPLMIMSWVRKMEEDEIICCSIKGIFAC